MGWAEARERVGPGVFQEHFFESDWPPPTDPDFWALVNTDEIAPFIGDQMAKWAVRDPEIGVMVATEYSYSTGSRDPLDEGDVSRILEEGTVFSKEVLDGLLSGPMTSLLLTRFGIPEEEQNKPYEEIAAGHQDLPDVSGSLSDGMRALAWYAFWLGSMRRQGRRNYEEGTVMVATLTQGFGFTPPEII